MEVEFLRYYTQNMYQKIQQYVLEYSLSDEYIRACKDKDDLLKFGFYHGILPIVAFCYCVLKCEVDIDLLLKSVPGSETYDKFKYRRQQCAEYLVNVKRYSKYVIVNGRHIYHVLEKYIEDYDLIVVPF